MTCSIWIYCCHNANSLGLGCSSGIFEEGRGVEEGLGGGAGGLMMVGGSGIWIVSGVGMSNTLLFEFDRVVVEPEAQLPWNWQW